MLIEERDLQEFQTSLENLDINVNKLKIVEGLIILGTKIKFLF